MDKSAKPEDPRLKLLFEIACQHCVGVFHVLRDPDKALHPQAAVFSGVFAKHQGDFYLVTAAHCIIESRKAIQNGLTSDSVSLGHGSGDGNRTFVPNFITNDRLVSLDVLSEKQGNDFACIKLGDVVVAKLLGSGMVPVEERFCALPGESVEHHAVFGLPETRNPSEYIAMSRQTIVRPHAMVALLKVPADRSQIQKDPVGPPVDSDPRFIAIVNERMAKEVGMRGLSGGLMFGVDLEERKVNGKSKKIPHSRPIAIQAKWWDKKYAAGNFMVHIFEMLSAT